MNTQKNKITQSNTNAADGAAEAKKIRRNHQMKTMKTMTVILAALALSTLFMACDSSSGSSGTIPFNNSPKNSASNNTVSEPTEQEPEPEPEPEAFDPFDGLVVIYDGISGKGTVTLNSVKTKMPDLQFTASETAGLSNGQTVTVSITGEQTEEDVRLFCLEQGLAPTAYEKEYTVEGLPWFAQELSEVPEETLTSIIKNAGVMLRDRDNETWHDMPNYDNYRSSNFRVDDLNLLHAYFMTTTTAEDVVNQLVLIYQEDVYYIDGGMGRTHNDRYYNYAVFSNFVLSNDKSTVLQEFGEYTLCKNTFQKNNFGDYAMFYGYTTEDEIYQKYVKSLNYKYIVEEFDLAAYGVA